MLVGRCYFELSGHNTTRALTTAAASLVARVAAAVVHAPGPRASAAVAQTIVAAFSPREVAADLIAQAAARVGAEEEPPLLPVHCRRHWHWHLLEAQVREL